MSTLYKNIMRLCERNGIKGGKMCSDIGLSRGFLTDLKYGRKQTASAETVRRIADYFGVSSDVVLYGEEKEIAQTDSSLDDEIMDKVHRINENDDTREMLDALMHRSDLRALLHMGKDATPEQIEGLVEMLRRFKGSHE